MRKNKKLLLASVAAMGALALGVGATSTFAWFQSAQTAQVASLGDASDSVAVGETAVTISNLKARINLVVGDAYYYNGSSATALSTSKPLLTTWATEDNGVYTADMANGTNMVTGAVAAGQTNQQAGLRALESSEIGWVYFELSVWLEDTTAPGDKGAQHDAIWLEAAKAASATAQFTFSRKSTSSLNADEIFYYVTDAVSAPTSYTKANEAKSAASEPDGHKITSPTAGALATAGKTASNALQHIGWLVMRLDGTNRVHTHGETYTAILEATGSLDEN